MKKYISVSIVLIVISFGFLSTITNNSNAFQLSENKLSQNIVLEYKEYDDKVIGSNPHAIIETSMGTIKIELYKDLAPNTVNNFINLTNISFYNGLVFHRVIDDFVIQGGGYYPDGTRKESPFGTIDLEIHPKARHVDGAIGMARTSDPNSATSQFYICDGPQHFLDDEYAVFGKVTIKTMPVVRKIASVETTTKYGMNDWPIDDIIINSVTIKEKSKDVVFIQKDLMNDYQIFFPVLKRLLHDFFRLN